SGDAKKEVRGIVTSLRHRAKSVARGGVVDGCRVAAKVEVRLVGTIWNGVQDFLPVAAAELELVLVFDPRVVLFAAHNLCVLRPRYDAMELHALEADIQQIRRAVHVERIRSAELGGNILLGARLIEAV